jgi:PadR family transcriptional regulator
MGDSIGEFEQLVLLALLRAGPDASGVAIHDEIVERTGRDVSIPAVYVTLARLELKGYVRSRSGEATTVRGGRARKLVTLTATGEAVLRHSRWVLERMWRGTGLRAEP